MNLKVDSELQGQQITNPKQKIDLRVVEEGGIACAKCQSKNYVKAGFTAAGTQRHKCKNCKSLFVKNSRFVERGTINDDDVIKASELGLTVLRHKTNGGKLTFYSIKQQWLKEEIKRYIRYMSVKTTSFNTVGRALDRLKIFSCFLESKPHVNKIEDIDRLIIIDYLHYLAVQNFAAVSRSNAISVLKYFLEYGSINGWFEIESNLIRKEDYPKRNKVLPRYIPDEIVNQLNQHLDSLPESVMRMLLVIQECGLRISELCYLPLNCLKQDAKGAWFIQFMRWKMKFETTLPVSIELAQVIQDQQAYIEQYFGKDFNYLFCGRKTGCHGKFMPVAKIMSSDSFIGHIKRLAKEFNICDNTGKRWNFHTHQFRHTVGTRMINNGVPQHIVQRYLGHDSPQMTAVYAHIHDSTLRKAIDQYLGTKVVDINGEIIQSITPELDNNSELQWLKKKVLAETLSNGYCGLPAQLTCSKGNACLTCSDFRTTLEYLDQHKQHLERTDRVLAVAQSNGWERQIQVNQDVKNSLEKIIATLEEQANA